MYKLNKFLFKYYGIFDEILFTGSNVFVLGKSFKENIS